MTSKNEDSDRGREARRIVDGFFRRGVIVEGRAAPESEPVELGSRVFKALNRENTKAWGGLLARHDVEGRIRDADGGKG